MDNVQQDKTPSAKGSQPLLRWLAIAIIIVTVLGFVLFICVGAVMLKGCVEMMPPARPELDPLVLVFPGAAKVEELSYPDIYVGNCCTAHQLGYYTLKPMSEVRAFYESELGKTFTGGFGFPPHPNFKDYGQYSSCMAVFLCRPDCETPDHTSQSIVLIDANELLEKDGTAIILQIHEETYWYRYEHIRQSLTATANP
jgi:hypothetical protein